MTSQRGYFNGFDAVRYSDGKVYYSVNRQWFRAVGQEHAFVPR